METVNKAESITPDTLGLIEEKNVKLFGRTTLWRLRRKGKLPHYRIGNRIFYAKHHLESLLTAHEQTSVK